MTDAEMSAQPELDPAGRSRSRVDGPRVMAFLGGLLVIWGGGNADNAWMWAVGGILFAIGGFIDQRRRWAGKGWSKTKLTALALLIAILPMVAIIGIQAFRAGVY